MRRATVTRTSAIALLAVGFGCLGFAISDAFGASDNPQGTQHIAAATSKRVIPQGFAGRLIEAAYVTFARDNPFTVHHAFHFTRPVHPRKTVSRTATAGRPAGLPHRADGSLQVALTGEVSGNTAAPMSQPALVGLGGGSVQVAYGPGPAVGPIALAPTRVAAIPPVMRFAPFLPVAHATAAAAATTHATSGASGASDPPTVAVGDPPAASDPPAPIPPGPIPPGPIPPVLLTAANPPPLTGILPPKLGSAVPPGQSDGPPLILASADLPIHALDDPPPVHLPEPASLPLLASAIAGFAGFVFVQRRHG